MNIYYITSFISASANLILGISFIFFIDILKYNETNFFGLAGIRGHKFSQKIIKQLDEL